MVRKKKVTQKLPSAVQIGPHKWRCQVQVDGQRENVIGETEYEAQIAALAVKARLLEVKEQKRKSGPTIREACVEYIALHEPVASPATVRGYYSTVKNRFQTIMDLPCTMLTPKLLQTAVNTEIKAGKSVKSVKNDIGLVRPAIREYNPIDNWTISYPVSIQKEHKILQKVEIPKLIDLVRGDDAELQILLALMLAMRRSEILGLMWDCVDLERRTLTVMRSMVQGKDCRKVIKDVPKTSKSYRKISLPDRIVELMSETPPDERDGLLFHHDYNYATQHLNRICRKHGVTVAGLHGMRHTNASLMSSFDIPEKVAMLRGGWSTPHVMKKVYTHAFEDDVSAAAEMVNGYFNRLTED